MLTDGPIVGGLAAAARARRPRPGVALTEDPDLHLLADGERLEAETMREGGAAVSGCAGRSATLRIVSRAADPGEVGTGPRPAPCWAWRCARSCWPRRRRSRCCEWDDAAVRCLPWFPLAEPLERHRWTDGEAALPLALLAGLRGGTLVELHVGANGLLPYPVTEPARHLPGRLAAARRGEAYEPGVRW